MPEYPPEFSLFPQDFLAGLQPADALWQKLKNSSLPIIPEVIKSTPHQLANLSHDVVIAGGTLGILIGLALVKRGWKVALMERGILRGREQEWNISRHELEVFLALDLLSEIELNQVIFTEYNPARVSFNQGGEVWVRDVLNLGVSPVLLLAKSKQKFIELGGNLLENTPFQGAVVHPDGVAVNTGKQVIKTRLFIDAMGHFSPVVQQVRQGKKPDGICLVVGSCAQGFDHNQTGDLLVSFTPILNQCQYFWEAFPARDGRTTYLFTYVDAQPERFSLEFLFTEYLRLLPAYQNIQLEQLKWIRGMFGFFPSYRQSPLQMPWQRMLAVGDSSGGQSPLSFGGFGAMLRHLNRLTLGLESALKTDSLSQEALALLQPYQPNLSVTWLFQKAMTVGVNQNIKNPQQINQLLSAVFAQMSQLGEPVLQPFLQDVVQFSPLTQTLLKTAFHHPQLIANLIPQLGITPLGEWLRHYLNLGVYTGLFGLGRRLKNTAPEPDYYFNQQLQAWKYGAGKDFLTNRLPN